MRWRSPQRQTPRRRRPFDVVRTEIKTEGDTAVFRIAVSGEAGADRPAATGTFAGSRVYAYVWPTSLDSSAAGFDPTQGIVAPAVTFHPDFDDGVHGVKNSAVCGTPIGWFLPRTQRARAGSRSSIFRPGPSPGSRRPGRACRCKIRWIQGRFDGYYSHRIACFHWTLPGRLRSPDATLNTSATQSSGAWRSASAVTPS
jgi:hypothetical protein